VHSQPGCHPINAAPHPASCLEFGGIENNRCKLETVELTAPGRVLTSE